MEIKTGAMALGALSKEGIVIILPVEREANPEKGNIKNDSVSASSVSFSFSSSSNIILSVDKLLSEGTSR